MELQYAGTLIATGRSEGGTAPASLLGSGILIGYRNRGFILTSQYINTGLGDEVDLVAIAKVHDGEQARRIQFELNRSKGYRLVHPEDQMPVTRGFQLFYISNDLGSLKQKGLAPFMLPPDPTFPELTQGQTLRILGLHARQINQKVLGADDLVLPWSLSDAELLSTAPHELAPTEHSPLRYKNQWVARHTNDDITDDWFGSLCFVEAEEGWYPLGIQSLHHAHLLNPKVITQESDHPPILGLTPLQSIYETLNRPPS
jgi:hypothetical protein